MTDYANKTRLLGKRNRLSDNAKTAIAVVILFSAYALVGTLEYNDLSAAQTEIKVCRGE